ncbi:uncharacterized protein LOC132266975 [Cornus florida]|uniref:uncharacterized protein LOC132266975 n=1 Tax=Cornus florida TaxID=4283 RepID=UPI00289A61F6|nr:uncharacterized protein LOC132266975 [Cornus florida]
MARAFVADSKRDILEFRDKLLEVVSDARNCYVDGSTGAYDDEAFVRMMFVDGCFLLYFIDKVLQGKYNDLEELAGHLGFGRWPVLIGDLILLENQLPFLVLQTLMSVRFPEDAGKGLIETYIDVYFIQDLEARKMMISGQRSNGTKYDGDQQPLHLLELTRRRFFGSTKGEDGPPSGTGLRGHRATKQINSFRSATELEARGIHFRPSNTYILNDFTFSSRFLHGRVTLPQVVVDIQTKRVFSNMMADELAPFGFGVQKICNYIYFMNSLINGADDVIELRSHRIIYNLLGTDEEVAKLFNNLAAFCGDPLLSDKTKAVITGIKEHNNSKRKTWTAQLLHNYFSSPWTALAFFAQLLHWF